jgi:hypothetical protein
MNERFRQLYYECQDESQSTEQCYQKFAELIVRECAKFMDENSGYNDSDGCWFPEPEDMLKHFGVEE